MKLVYDDTGIEVKIGDTVIIGKEPMTITYFSKPHKPASSGKVSVAPEGGRMGMEYYVSIIGATWIEREDRS